MNKKNILLIFGFGYTAKFMCQKFSKKNWEVFCTTRFKEKAKEIKSLNATPIFFDDEEKIESVLSKNSYILSTAPPENSKDPVVENYGHLLKKNSERVKWAGYLSTTSVYGDKKGEWVTEDTELEPNLERSISRVAAENSWIKLGENLLIKTVIFRLAGIYGPGRSLVDRLMKDEDVYIVDKPAHLFNRIHVDDIVGAIEMAISSKSEAKIFNLSDDLPAKQLDVAKFAASLLKRKSPQTVSLESDLVSEMARSFYKEEKKVSNTRLKDELGYKLVFPSFKEGLFSIHKNSKEF
jgi:nucleoside-diphosphate-sugar epimerase|tara:strand:+ start:468 stop:1349 length:882 start_codon:yes stop_codon:yes gene_type:complete